MISRYSIAHESLFPNMKLSVAQEQTITSRDWGFTLKGFFSHPGYFFFGHLKGPACLHVKLFFGPTLQKHGRAIFLGNLSVLEFIQTIVIAPDYPIPFGMGRKGILYLYHGNLRVPPQEIRPY